MRRLFLILFLLVLSHSSCKCAQTSSTPDYEGALQSVSRVITAAPSSDRFAMTRLTPEQMSATMGEALGLPNLWGANSAYDPIVDFFGVALGGVDFQSTFERDRSAKIQTLLVARSLAMMVALTVVGQEASRADEDKLLFTIANMHSDSPNEGAVRWTEQSTDLYWRLLARAPTEEEIAAHAEAFLSVAQGSNMVTQNSDGSSSQWTGWGWATVLYALLSSEEFWNL